MDHNPFISRNNDLIIMFVAGCAMVLIVNFFTIAIQQQFLMMLIFGFLAGIFMSYLYQSLEWALFFTLGVLIVALSPEFLRFALGGTFNIGRLVHIALESGEYTLFLLSSWLISIPSGFMLQRLVMANYYKKNTI